MKREEIPDGNYAGYNWDAHFVLNDQPLGHIHTPVCSCCPSCGKLLESRGVHDMKDRIDLVIKTLGCTRELAEQIVKTADEMWTVTGCDPLWAMLSACTNPYGVKDCKKVVA